MTAEAVATMVIQALPWVVLVVILAGFVLVDELPASRVRRVSVAAGIVLVAASVVAVVVVPVRTAAEVIVIAIGPLAFLLLHVILRLGFLRLKGSEPVLTFTPDAHRGRSTRLWYEPDASRRVGAWDHVYSMLIGLATLLSAAPAIAEIIRRS